MWEEDGVQEVRLENDEGSWIEMSHETLQEHFKSNEETHIEEIKKGYQIKVVE